MVMRLKCRFAYKGFTVLIHEENQPQDWNEMETCYNYQSYRRFR